VNDHNQTSKSKRNRVLIGLIASTTVIAAAWAGLAPDAIDPRELADSHVVTRGMLRISVEGEASLEPIRKYVTDNEYRYTTKVISAQPEGVMVKEGDIVVELDATQVADRLEKQELDVERSGNLLTQARETLTIEESLADGRIAAAQLEMEFAETNLLQYVDGTWPQQKRNLELAIQQVEEELLLAKEQLGWAEKLEEKGFETKKALAEQNLTVTRLTASLEKARENLRIALTYDFPRMKRRYESRMREAKLDFEREQSKTAARLAKYRGNVKTREYVLDNEVDRLNWYKGQIEAAKIRAKRDGMVVYPQTRYSSSRGPIEEGTTVYYGQSILSIPDTSQMKVSFMVHESDIHRLKMGQTARVELDSYKGDFLTARLSKIAHTPDGMTQYYRPGMKVYKTEAIVEGDLPEDVRPGMSGSATIEIANLEDVVTVPLKAVTSINGERVCVVRNGEDEELRKVTTGYFNDHRIQVLSGLSEGETVSLSPPVGEGARDQEVIETGSPTAHFDEREYTRSLEEAMEAEESLMRSGG